MTGNFQYIEGLSNLDLRDGRPGDYQALNDGLNSDIFSYSLKDFLRQCILRQPEKRSSAKDLLDHIWIREMEEERKKQQELLRQVRMDFERRFKDNYQNLKHLTR